MAKQFTYTTPAVLATATVAKIEGMTLADDGGVGVSVGIYDSNEKRIDSKHIRFTKAQANIFFNNFNAAGGGVFAFHETILNGLVNQGHLPAGSISDV